MEKGGANTNQEKTQIAGDEPAVDTDYIMSIHACCVIVSEETDDYQRNKYNFF